MDLGSILLGVALLVIVSLVVSRPLLEGVRVRERQPGPVDQLLAERERVLLALRDLDFDFATGKIVAEEHAAQRAVLVAQGVDLLKQLDQLAGKAPAAGGVPADDIEPAVAQRREPAGARTGAGRPASAALEDQIEARVAARRGAPAAGPARPVTCSQCGASARAGDRFCPQCGSGLPAALTCQHCGRAARPGDQFCAGCGQPLPAAAGGLRQAQANG